MTNPCALIAFQHAKPERRDALIVLLRDLAAHSRTEEGCLQYELHQLADDPCVFAFFERWASKSALDRHFTSEIFQAFWQRRMEFLQRDVEVKFLAPI